ncbi:DUF2889 domain-containing protein [Vogesella sp. LIG4]|uniref:DUF2889 domain-containing protein n=1 Tax=Vogesella sp. LIG4 TaxID=1192162 RepID=UPI00081F8D0D|nr:DUF2889 domain-containing protein [Vogesella sp. LIG4]SCK30091.1 Protein of unknown function [Vogesella sp. LIG4]
MPLSPPAERSLFHHRQIHCRGYRRQDGLWDIEGSIVDTKGYALTFYDGRPLAPGLPLHEMHLRLTVDDDLLIHAAEASTEHAPFPPCPEINPAYRQLLGLRIAPGFSGQVRELFKGRAGCTHLTELLGPMATTALQTLASGRRYLAQWEAPEQLAALSAKGASLIDSCHGWRSDGEPVAVKFPQRYTGVPRPAMPDQTRNT